MSSTRSILLFEDAAVGGLHPLTLTRPACELRSGALNLRERAEMAAPERVRLACRPSLRTLLEATLPDLAAGTDDPGAVVLAVNARARVRVEDLEGWLARPPREEIGEIGTATGKAILWAQLGAARAAALADGREAEAFDGLPRVRAEGALFDHPWDLVAANGEDLCRDWRSLGSRPAPPRRIFGVALEEGAPLAGPLAETALGDASRCVLYPGVHILEEAHVLFGPGAVCKPGVVLDASEGPILLGAGCRVEANAVIQGPAYVGPGSTVHPLTRLREGSSVGAGCKVGGEIEEVVMLDLSNKQHDGFLGHAALGSWVNLGADTNASDLKNNYGTVKVDLGEGPVDTGRRFVGPTLGDHVRTGINSMLTTGAVVGVCANLFGADFPPRFVPSYAWGGAGGLESYDLEKALQTARTVLARRRVRWLPAYEDLLRRVHADTAAQRAPGR